MNIIISIHPFFALKILDGEKTVELRKVKPKQLNAGDLGLIYATAPIKSIIGAFEVEGVIELPVQELWEKTKGLSSISQKNFEDYFQNSTTGVGIYIKRAWKIEFNRRVTTPPQSFKYIKGDFLP